MAPHDALSLLLLLSCHTLVWCTNNTSSTVSPTSTLNGTLGPLGKGSFLPLLLPTASSSTTPTSRVNATSTTTTASTVASTSTTTTTSGPSSSSMTPMTPSAPSTTSTSTSATANTTFETLPSPMPVAHHSQFKWNSVMSGQQNSLSYTLNCTPDFMSIEVNLTGVEAPFVYLEKLKSFSICRPKMIKSNLATFHLALDDNFYRCGTTKVHDQVTGTRIYYNRVIVESKGPGAPEAKSIYFKCSLPSASKILGSAMVRPKRQLIPSGPGRLVNFTEIDLPDNFMEAEILDFDQNITARAPYPHLNIKVKRNGEFVNNSLNVAPGTPLEMIIYLDDDSKSVYGLLASFMKVTDNSSRQKEEVIVLNGCSIDPYIFGNFETPDRGDSISATFRAFKFPESSYVMFVGSVNVCLDECKGVACGNDIVAYGRRRRRRSIPDEAPKDPNKVFEIEMITYLQVGYSGEEAAARKEALRGSFDDAPAASSSPYAPAKLTISSESTEDARVSRQERSDKGDKKDKKKKKKNGSMAQLPSLFAILLMLLTAGLFN